MRSFATLSLFAIIMAACSGPAGDSLQQLQQQRDSLAALSDDIGQQMADIKEQLATLDTNSAQHVVNVTALQLHPQRFEHFFKVQGVVEAEHNALIYPEAGGRITNISVSEGQRVSKGQTLMTIDSRVLANQIDEVQERLSLLKKLYEKQDRLWQQQVGSEIQYLEAKNNYESTKQSLEVLMAQLDFYTLKAPFAGVVDEVVPKVGEMAGPQAPAFRLISMKDAYMKADITEGYLSKLEEGDSVDIYYPSLDARMASTISRIGYFINPNNRSFKIRIELGNSDLPLKPNLMGELEIRDYVSDSAAVIPSSLIQMTPAGDEFVYIIKYTNGSAVAEKAMIESGISYEGNSEVLSGLRGDETLVSKGARSIKNGDVIEVSK